MDPLGTDHIVTLFVGKVDFRNHTVMGGLISRSIIARTKGTRNVGRLVGIHKGRSDQRKGKAVIKGRRPLTSKRTDQQVIASMWDQRDDKKVDKRTSRRPAHCWVAQTRPHAVPYAHFHRLYATNPLHCRRVRSGGAHRPYNALHVQTSRGGRALH